MLAEDTGAEIRRDVARFLFAFGARSRALEQAAKRVAAFRDPLPADAPPSGATVARPGSSVSSSAPHREEQARVAEEAKLGDASGDLVRAIVATWTAPAIPEEWPAPGRVGQQASPRDPRFAPAGAAAARSPDLDVALYPLERLLAPLQFPRGAAAIAQLRMGLDEDMRAVPALVVPERVALEAKVHLGVRSPRRPSASASRAPRPRLAGARGRGPRGKRRPAHGGRGRARQLLLVERPCPAVPGTRVRSMGPPPEAPPSAAPCVP